MSERHEDELLRYDETILDDHELGDAVGELPQDPELREELMRQRLAHGMLRSLHGRNEFARERRIRDIMEDLPPLQEASGRVFGMRPGLSLAAAILVSGIIATVFLWGTDNREIQKIMAEAMDVLEQDVDRRYTLTVSQLLSSGTAGAEFEQCGFHEIQVRPGKLHMVLNGKHVGRWEIGCDGYEMWRRKIDEHDQLGPVEVRPMENAPDFMKEFTRGGLVDHGYLDIVQVFRAIPDHTHLEIGERKALKDGGPILTPIHVEHDFKFLGGDVDDLTVWIEEDSDFVHRMEFELEDHLLHKNEIFSFEFDFVGVVVDVNGDPYKPPR